MSRFHVEVRIAPRRGLLDPEGKAVQGALRSLDFGEVRDVRVGRLIRLEVSGASAAEAKDRVDEMCRKLLANPVTEDYEIALEEG